ncbi:MAG: hypothetical protein KBS63_06480 [Clostridiales bacterium]|nr:hypothetical protein [Candidatus Crickella caballi]
MKRRILSILLSLTMIFTMMPMMGAAAYAAESDISQQTQKVVLTTSDSGSEFSTSTFNEGGVRSTARDKDGNLWVGTYGGGLLYNAKDSDDFVAYNMSSEPALTSTIVSAVCPDANGGVWFTQNEDNTNGFQNSGVAYMKDGKLTYYQADDEPATIPDNNVQDVRIDKSGNVWFGSYGGLTKYDPKAETWQTWDVDDGFPAMSVDNIEFDRAGGIWCGFYPDSELSDGSGPYVGGFAYFKDGEVVKYQYTSEMDSNTGEYRLADVWVRDIAADADGGAWIVASGSHGGMNNHGGKVWYVDAPGNPPEEYTGYDLFGEDNFQTDSELRAVAIDPDGGLWFGTSKDGIFYVADSMIIGGQLELTEKFSSAENSWATTDPRTARQFDDVYTLDFYGKTLYAGSEAGLATRTFEFENDGEARDPSESGSIQSVSIKDENICYDGTPKAPAVTVKNSLDQTLVKGVDYEISYKNNTKVGKATVTVTGTGNYKGTITKTFKINPKKAVVYKATPGKKKFTVKMKTRVASTGGATYQIAYKQKGKNKWKYTTTTKQSKVIKKLRKGKRYYVKVRAYKKLGSTKYYGAWSKTKLSSKIK